MHTSFHLPLARSPTLATARAYTLRRHALCSQPGPAQAQPSASRLVQLPAFRSHTRLLDVPVTHACARLLAVPRSSRRLLLLLLLLLSYSSGKPSVARLATGRRPYPAGLALTRDCHPDGTACQTIGNGGWRRAMNPLSGSLIHPHTAATLAPRLLSIFSRQVVHWHAFVQYRLPVSHTFYLEALHSSFLLLRLLAGSVSLLANDSHINKPVAGRCAVHQSLAYAPSSADIICRKRLYGERRPLHQSIVWPRCASHANLVRVQTTPSERLGRHG